MSRIVVTTIGSLGDLHPKIALALELRQRGHDLVFATHQGYQGKIEDLGFEFHRMRPEGTENPEEIARMTNSKTGSEYVVRNWLLPSLPETYADLMDAAKNADFMIAGEIVYAAPLVAEKLGIRWATPALSPFSMFSAYDPSAIAFLPFLAKLRGLGVPFNRGVIQLLKTLTQSWAEPIHRLRAELNLPQRTGSNPLIDDKFSPYLVLAMFDSLLAQPQPDWPKNTITTCFTFYDGNQQTELIPELQQFLEAGAPPLVFTLGSANVLNPGNFYSESIQAAKQLNHRAVLLMGGNTLPDNLPPNIIAIDYAPYSKVFPYASVIVHQGGIGTTAQALRAGRPTLIMPYTYDQPDNAARVQRLGTSRTINPKQYTARQVAIELIELITNSAYLTKAKEIGQIIQTKDGVGVACDAIEKQL